MTTAPSTADQADAVPFEQLTAEQQDILLQAMQNSQLDIDELLIPAAAPEKQ